MDGGKRVVRVCLKQEEMAENWIQEEVRIVCQDC